MEKMKDPAFLLSAAGAIGLIGNTVYFYKQIEALRESLTRMETSLNSVVGKVSKLEREDTHTKEAITTLGGQIKEFNSKLDQLPSLASVKNINTDIEDIIISLKDSGITVNRPNLTRLPVYERPNSFRDNDRDRDWERERERERDREREKERERERQERERDRDRERERDRVVIPRSDVGSYDVDADLIRQVRGQK